MMEGREREDRGEEGGEGRDGGADVHAVVLLLDAGLRAPRRGILTKSLLDECKISFQRKHVC